MYTQIPLNRSEKSHNIPPMPPSDPAADAARRHATARIGAPHHFDIGPFAGKTIRATLTSIQDAEMGRKCADPPKVVHHTTHLGDPPGPASDTRVRPGRKDRRPLDPPPVVQLRIFEVFDEGTDRETEREIPSDIIRETQFICQAELFPCRPAPSIIATPTSSSSNGHVGSSAQPSAKRRKRTMSSATVNPVTSPASTLSSPTGYPHTPSANTANAPYPFNFSCVLPTSDVRQPVHDTYGPPMDAMPGVQDGSSSGSYGSTTPPAAPQVQLNLNNNMTQALFGSTYAHAASIIDLKGMHVIYFVFSDLAVKLEGTFVLRFRFFDLCSHVFGERNEPVVPILAECISGPFAVYSTKQFHGLKASTELTKQLQRFGIKVNSRETVRKRKKTSSRADGEGSHGAGAGHARRAQDDAQDDSEPDSPETD